MPSNQISTHHHNLPYIQGAQAQKHVTYNEGLRQLDAMVQLAVETRGLTVPPVSPAEGSRYIVGSAAVDAWTGHDGDIANFIDGAWQFFTPIIGWRSWILDEGGLLAWNGSDWAAIGSGASDRLGVNTTADATNRFALKSDAALFSYDDVTPGSGDMRHALNKAAAQNTVSQVFQTGFTGHAEIGLSGTNDLSIRTSVDGVNWRDSLIADRDSGFVSFPNGSDAGTRTNLLTNAGFRVDQRGFSGGSLAADTYGHDRWKAGDAGASYTVSSGIVSLTSGNLVQVVPVAGDMPQFVTFSVESITGAPLVVTVGGVSATLPAQAERQFASLAIAQTGSGTLELNLGGDSGATTFAKPKLENGPGPSPYAAIGYLDDLALCQRFFQILKVSLNTGSTGQTVTYAVPLKPEMVRNPDRTRVGAFVSSTETGTQFTGGATNSATSFGIYNGGTGGLGGVFHLDAEY